jgi:D-alanyl-D-alanine carboxypeptidase/D-alanyl-D-alanine-endopeptidase (penicillin-binding protein 4)
LAELAILEPDARASARLTAALTDAHRISVRASWGALDEMLAEGRVDGCLVDCDHPDRRTAARQIASLRERYPELAIVAYTDSRHSGGYFDLGKLGVDGVVTSRTPSTRLRNEVDVAFSRARGERIARALSGRFAHPGPAALAWAVAHASCRTGVEKLAAGLGHTPRGLRDALEEAGLPPPARVLLWGRLLLAGARLGCDDRTVEEVAYSVGYSTSTSLARAMKKHTGLTPKQAAARGGMDAVREAILPPPGGRRPGRQTLGALGLTFALSATGCAVAGLGGSGVDRGAIRDVLESPGIAQMHVGVLAVDAATGRTLVSHNADRKFVPASNQKILVTAAAMTMLGPDHRFRTEVWGTGSGDGSYLDGDLVVVGSGDPTLSGRYWRSGTEALEVLADSVRATGLEYVAGRLFVDVSAWDSTTVAPTREVEDLRYAYGSTGGAFAIDEGEIEIIVRGGHPVGGTAEVRWSPVGTPDYVRSRLKTSTPDSATRVTPHYLPETRQLVLEGSVQLGTVDTLSFALRDPVRQASAALAIAVERAGIELEGGWEVKWTKGEPVGSGCLTGMLEECSSAYRLTALESPPLSTLVAGILEPSQNWMTEQLLRALPALYGEEGSWSDGVDLVEAFLVEHVGVDSLAVSARDGSGLSAYNLVTPRALVRVLDFMRRGPFAAEYRAALAEPGEEGSSLERRLIDLEGRVFAKTGTISNVNSLSGFLVRDNGREVVFSVLTNASGLPSSYVRTAIDDIVRLLAR